MPDGLIFHNMPIVIDKWRKDETYDIYTVGSRDKDAYFSPREPKDKSIKPDWRYLFKLSRTTRTVEFPWQFWCEIIAYRFGSIIGVNVPPAHIGLSTIYENGVNTYAALIEWFYDEKEDVYITGEQIMLGLIEDFDTKKGRKHNLKTIRDFFKDREEALNYWARVLTFDTLIGNTDRHQENWGIIRKKAKLNPKEFGEVYLSPAFDNGTALGYEILEEKLDKFDDAKLKSYLIHKKAKHHMKWSLDEEGRLNFCEFMKKFALALPVIRPIMIKCLDFTYDQVEKALAPLVEAISDPKCKLTRKRLDFVLKLIFNRKRILEETLEL
jgi:HipA-like C-terminal domain